MTLAAPLLAVLDALGVDHIDAAGVETPTTLNHVFHVSGGAAATPPDDLLLAVPDAYGSSVTIEFRTAGMAELTVVPGLKPTEIAAFRSRVAAAPVIEVALRVDKPALIERMVAGAATDTVLFVFAAALERQLRSGLTAIANELWAHHGGRLIVLVLDTDINLHGRCLHILGGTSLLPTPDLSSLAAVAPAAFKRVVALRERLVGWNESFAGTVTPWHLAADGTGSDSLRVALDGRVLDLTLLYTCDRARRLPGDPTKPINIEFRGRDHVAALTFDERDTVTMTDHERETLLSTLDWVYELDSVVQERPDWAPDRLPFLQTRVAQVLEGGSGDRRIAFLHDLPAVLEGVRWLWKAFIEERVSSYLDDVKGLEEIVTDTTDKLSASIGDLTKSLSDTMLAAVAVLIGTFIAAAFDSPFNARLFRVGMLAYATYVMLFPGGLGLFSAWRQRCRAEDSFTYRRNSFETALGTERVTDIVGARINGVTRSFRQTLVLVALIYVLLVVGTALAAAIVPDFIAAGDRPSGATKGGAGP